jgi:hypothetical protein
MQIAEKLKNNTASKAVAICSADTQKTKKDAVCFGLKSNWIYSVPA